MNLRRKSCLTLSSLALAVALAPAADTRPASPPPAESDDPILVSCPNLDPDGELASQAE